MPIIGIRVKNWPAIARFMVFCSGRSNSGHLEIFGKCVSLLLKMRITLTVMRITLTMVRLTLTVNESIPPYQCTPCNTPKLGGEI